MAMASWVPPLIAARPLFLHLRILTTQHPPFKHTTQHNTVATPFKNLIIALWQKKDETPWIFLVLTFLHLHPLKMTN